MNKNSAIPLYQQLAETIKEQIASGKLKENDKLMAEKELCESYDVSRITVRKALELLSDEGLIIRKQGIGTFIASRKLDRYVDSILSFTETCEINGRKASAELISLEWKKASVSIAKHLGINEGEKVLCIRRLRSCDDHKVMLEENWFPQKYGYLVGEDLSGSIYKILRSHGTNPSHALKTIAICSADKNTQELLGVSEEKPLLMHTDTAMDEDYNVIHYTNLVIDPEHYTLTIVI